MELHKLFTWSGAWKAAATVRLRRRQYWVPLLTLVLWITLRLISEEAATWVLLRVGVMIPDLIAMPMGYGGLALMGLLGAVAILAYIDTRPRRVRKATPLPTEQRLVVDQMRVLYRDAARGAAVNLLDILKGTLPRLAKRNRLAGLLDQPINDLRSMIASFESDLGDHNLSVPRAKKSFKRFYTAYVGTALLVHRIVDSQIREEDLYQVAYEAWMKSHRKFTRELKRLALGSDFGDIDVNLHERFNYVDPREKDDY